MIRREGGGKHGGNEAAKKKWFHESLPYDYARLLTVRRVDTPLLSLGRRTGTMVALHRAEALEQASGAPIVVIHSLDERIRKEVQIASTF